MRNFIAGHSSEVFLKPGEVIISRNPIMVSTILGSCVAITLYSPAKKLGAICHAVHPHSVNREPSLQTVETAIRYIHCKMIEYGGKEDMVIKLFGGARVLAGGNCHDDRKTIGELNVIEAEKTLAHLGLVLAKKDVGGCQGRKLLFSLKTGEIFLRRLQNSAHTFWPGE